MITYAVKNISVLDGYKNVLCTVIDSSHKYCSSYVLDDNDNIIFPMKVIIRENKNSKIIKRLVKFKDDGDMEVLNLIRKIESMWENSSTEVKRLYL